MNILFLNNIPFNPEYGGIERVTDILTKALIERYNHKVYYLSFDAEKAGNYEYPAPLFCITSYSDYDTCRKYIAELVERYSIDIIINQRGQVPEICRMINNQKAKIINALHSQPTAWYKADLLRILGYTPVTIKEKVKYLIKVFLYPFLYYKKKQNRFKIYCQQYKYMFDTSDVVVLLSDRFKQELNLFVDGVIESPKVYGIPNPNTFLIRPDSASLDKEKIILYVGRLDRTEKAPLRLLQIWQRLYNRYKDWSLQIVGDGPDKQRMQEYALRHNLDRVFFEGAHSDVSEFYNRASFICLTSNFEGWGMALTEGMQHGCIPFTYNNYGAASDIIEDGVSGCLIKPSSLRNYAQRLSELMDDDDLRRKMSHEARKKVREFDTETVAMRWDRLFHTILG